MPKPLSQRVLFYAENCRSFYGSARLRGLRPAEMLGAKCVIGRKLNDDDLFGRDIFVLIKSSISAHAQLSNYGHVIWDVIDDPPPLGFKCLVSTKHTAEYLKIKDYAVIPHPSASRASTVPLPKNRDAYWIGTPKWKPSISSLHTTINSCHYSQADLDQVYRRAGILLNVRIDTAEAVMHSHLSSGIKLINSIAYGIPSITSNEPWLDEIGRECTLTGNVETEISRLKEDTNLYNDLREKCLAKQHLYSPSRIKALYESFLSSL